MASMTAVMEQPGRAAPAAPLIPDDMLQRFQQRAPGYDRDNRFFFEDFEELRDAGYLTMNVPVELGGRGYSLAQAMREQRRIGYFAAPTALAMNMHAYWVGNAADLWRSGDTSLEWLLREAANGAVFAAGHAESGNDIPVLLSTTRAERVDGGWTFTGRKSFGSLSPVWSYLGLHGIDTSDPAAPRIVHAFMPRDTPGYSIKETWDTLGMRATRSDDTVLENVFVPDRYIARIVPAGSGALGDPFIVGIFAWALLGFGNIYYGMGRRALDLAVATIKDKQVLHLTRPMVHHAGVQQAIGEMVLALESIGPYLDRVADDYTVADSHGPEWVLPIIGAKHHAVENAWRVVDRALDVAGGFGIFRRGPFEQLFRDARLGRIHPANSMLTHELAAKITLGLNPDDAPRWG